MTAYYRWVVVTLTLLFPVYFSAAAVTAAPAQQSEEQIRQQARDTAIAASKLYGSQPAVLLQEPPRSYIDWGAVLRTNGSVLVVRSNSTAAQLGLQQGDVVQQVDDLVLTEVGLDAVLGYLESLEHQQQVTLQVLRQQQSITLSGPAQATLIPGWRLIVDHQFNELNLTTNQSKVCGRISVFQQPPAAHDLYAVLITRINNRSIDAQTAVVQLSPGTYQIELMELIASKDFRRYRQQPRTQTFSLEVAANTTYHLGAQYPLAAIDDNSHDWLPKVWKRTQRQCTAQ